MHRQLELHWRRARAQRHVVGIRREGVLIHRRRRLAEDPAIVRRVCGREGASLEIVKVPLTAVVLCHCGRHRAWSHRARKGVQARPAGLIGKAAATGIGIACAVGIGIAAAHGIGNADADPAG